MTRPPAMAGATSGQAARDVFVGKAVKPVAPHAFGVEALRDRVVVCQCIMGAMECRIEARDLRRPGHALQKRADRREVVGLMQRRERRIAFEPRKNLFVDQDRLIVLRSAMDHAVADGGRFKLLRFAQPRTSRLQRRRNILQLLGRIGLVDQLRLVCCFGAQPRLASNAVHLALEQALWPLGVGGEHLELDARGAGVDDEDRTHCGQAFGSAVLLRRASA